MVVDPRFGEDLPTPQIPSLKLTGIAPENGWLEYNRFLLGWPKNQGRAVSFREGN